MQNDECKGVVFVPFFEDMSGTNDHSQATNGDMSAANDPVVKESKLNSNKEEIGCASSGASNVPAGVIRGSMY